MAFNELFKEYPNRNSELRSLVKMFYEFGKTVAKEASAAHTYGLDEHSVTRQRAYIAKAKAKTAALTARPLPDRQGAARIQLPINMSEPYETYVTNVNDAQVPLNEATQLLAEHWMLLAAELATSNSAALPGSLITKDSERTLEAINVIEKHVDEEAVDIHSGGPDAFLDLPITAEPGSEIAVRS